MDEDLLRDVAADEVLTPDQVEQPVGAPTKEPTIDEMRAWINDNCSKEFVQWMQQNPDDRSVRKLYRQHQS